MKPYIIPFEKINLIHLPDVGGKNTSLGEMFTKLHPLGIEIPNGFVLKKRLLLQAMFWLAVDGWPYKIANDFLEEYKI